MTDINAAAAALTKQQKDSVMLCAGFCLGLSTSERTPTAHDKQMLAKAGEHLRALGKYLFALSQQPTKETNE